MATAAISSTYVAVDTQKKVRTEPLWTKENGKALGAAEIAHVKKRAASAQSADKGGPKPLPKLSKDYAKEKQAKGGSPMPDLRLTGAMLNSLQAEATKDKVFVGVDSRFAGQVAGLERAGRTFLGLNQGDMKATDKLLQDILDSKDLIPTPDMRVKDGNVTTKSSKKSGASPTYKRTV